MNVKREEWKVFLIPSMETLTLRVLFHGFLYLASLIHALVNNSLISKNVRHPHKEMLRINIHFEWSAVFRISVPFSLLALIFESWLNGYRISVFNRLISLWVLFLVSLIKVYLILKSRVSFKKQQQNSIIQFHMVAVGLNFSDLFGHFVRNGLRIHCCIICNSIKYWVTLAKN